MTGNLAIHADGLRKSYPGPGGVEAEAVRGLGLSVAKGSSSDCSDPTAPASPPPSAC
ncbi:hypothetical protein [Streptomyces sp. Ac-502]|uniref:hypothetical protein n=1 Tax=Streptomyces sp. Ac-502 TaxID=3342801 RepID=UPI003862C670